MAARRPPGVRAGPSGLWRPASIENGRGGAGGGRLAALLCVWLCLGGGWGAAAADEEPSCVGEECVQAEPAGGPAGIAAPGTRDPLHRLPSTACDPGAAPRHPDAPPRLGILLQQAQEQIGSGKHQEAARSLQEYLRKNPGRDNVLLEFLLGNALFGLGRTGEALDAYRKAVGLDPCYGPAWVNLGQAAMERQEYPLAAEAFARGHALTRPEEPAYLYYAAVAHVLDNGHGRAVPLLESLPGNRSGRPNPEWARTLLHAYVELGRNAQAEALLERMLASFPDDTEVWRYAYRFEANRGRYERAVVHLVVLSYLTELTREERLLLGDLYGAIRVPLAASEQYERALGGRPAADDVERLALSYLAAHRPAAARETLRRVLAETPSAKLWLLLGEIQFMEEDLPGAFEAFRESARLDPGEGRAQLMTGYCAVQMSRWEEAVPALRKAREFARQREDAERLLDQAERARARGKDTRP